jgi:hypothetical protein
MARRKKDNPNTTISISWKDKEEFRKYAKLVKQTKTGDRYESDAVLFRRLLKFWIENNTIYSPHSEPRSTYPSLNKSQPSSDSSESN